MAKLPSQHITVQRLRSGMRRFFSATNLDRYRILASTAVGEAEQHQLLRDLAEEMNAFRREACEAPVNRPRPFKEDMGSQVSD
jgi:hypothetical protein